MRFYLCHSKRDWKRTFLIILFLITAMVIGVSGCCRVPMNVYQGSWVLRAEPTGDPDHREFPVITMQISGAHHRIRGIVEEPAHYHEEPDGTFNSVSSQISEGVITGIRIGKPLLDLSLRRPGSKAYWPIMLLDSNHMVVGGFPGTVPPWRFEKVEKLPLLDLRRDWPETVR